MKNCIGGNVKQYRNVIVRDSTIGSDTTLADDVFVTDSVLGNCCTIERRGMVFNSTIGDYSYTGYNTVVKYADIGKFCSISWNVSIGGANHDYHTISTHPFSFISKYGFTNSGGGGYHSFDNPLRIGNDVWFGCNAVIMRGVTIGDGAVIGASSVVTKDVPPYSVVVGNPGKVIKYRFDEDIVCKLLNMKWWNWTPAFLSANLSYFQDETLTMRRLNELEEKFRLYAQDEGIIVDG